MNEAGLLDPGDDLDVHAGLLPGPPEEHAAVLRLPDGAGRHRRDRGAMDVRDLPEARQGGDPPVDRILIEVLHVTAPRAEPHHLLLPLEDLQAPEAPHAGDHEMDRVRPDVDGGEDLWPVGRRRLDGGGTAPACRTHGGEYRRECRGGFEVHGSHSAQPIPVV